MDWRSVTFDWNRARAFLVTAEEGSLSAAARALGLTQPTLGRQVAALEAELGVTLFERVGRGLALTDSGADLVAHVRQMGDGARRLSLAASGHSQAIAGRVSITVSEILAGHLLPPILARLRAAHPGIEVEIVASNTLTDLRRREADIAVRSARPTDPELTARKLGDGTARFYAASDYLARRGTPRSSEALARADFIGFEDNADYLDRIRALGVPVTEASFPLRTANHLVQWQMVRAGLGIGVMPCLVGEAEPDMQRVGAWLAPFSYPVWLVAHREIATSRRIRLVFDLLADEIETRLRDPGA